MENDLILWLRENLQAWRPTKEDVLRATRHLHGLDKLLASKETWDMRQAVGSLHEYLVYDRIVETAQKSDLVKAIVMKGNDVVRTQEGPAARLGQNGFFYSGGNIYLRGNGQDLAEFDALIISRGRDILPIETVVTKINFNDLEDEAEYKKTLLNYLFQRSETNFVLVSSLDFEKSSQMNSFISKNGNHFLQTGPVDEIVGNLSPAELRRQTESHEPRKLISAKELEIRQFDYSRIHDEERKNLLKDATEGASIDLQIARARSSIVKNVFLGALAKDALSYFLDSFELREKQLGKVSVQSFPRYFTRAVLVISMPKLRPILYLRQHKPNYAKFGPSTMSRFEFERNIDSHYTRVFDWLETVHDLIDASSMRVLLQRFLRREVVGRQMRKPQVFRLK
jgi:hypothetical protein